MTPLSTSHWRLAALLSAGLLLTAGAAAQEAAIRKNLAERLPNFPKIDEVSKTPIPGLFEIRIGTDVLYTDEQGNHVIQGQIIDTRTRANLTEDRIEKLAGVQVVEDLDSRHRHTLAGPVQAHRAVDAGGVAVEEDVHDRRGARAVDPPRPGPDAGSRRGSRTEEGREGGEGSCTKGREGSRAQGRKRSAQEGPQGHGRRSQA